MNSVAMLDFNNKANKNYKGKFNEALNYKETVGPVFAKN